ncbi:4Fe-4S ferredoxin [Desulfovibrio sp. OttesenSCG-928-G15]|nr:4Fe-4S ferredoxin [Desulfovibrio sp. OttesenSCG-928-G15]
MPVDTANSETGLSLSLITNLVVAFMQGPDNDLQMPDGPEPAFATPLIGVSSGADPLWSQYKTHVGDFHWTPQEAYALAFPDKNIAPEELSVITWILPQTEATKKCQRREKRFPAERWIHSKLIGEKSVNSGLRRHLVREVGALGVDALAPVLLDAWSYMDSERFVYASKWSERHAAYAAGLGTFGLCDGLITPVGKAVRVGSVVVACKLPVAERPYTSHREYCLFFNSGGICGKCIKRCPAGALSPKGHDKILCNRYAYDEADKHAMTMYGTKADSCGLCQTGVPCESGVPKAK